MWLGSPESSGSLGEAVRGMLIGPAELLAILVESTDDRRWARAAALVAGELRHAFDDLVGVLREEMSWVMTKAAHDC